MTTTIMYTVQLDEPAIFSALAGEPNSAVSYPYVPGSVIRGLVIGLYLKNNPHNDLAADSHTRRKFFSHSTRFLNAYPMIDGQCALPVPATWAVRKYKTDDEIANKTIHDNAFRSELAIPAFKPKSLSGFVRVAGKTVWHTTPEYDINVHTQRARRYASEQQIFRYEALADGQRFSGAILCDDSNDARAILKLLEDESTIVIGGSRTAGYGQATLTAVTTSTNWEEIPFRNGSEVIMTCLSDIILINTHGVDMPIPQTFEETLSQIGIVCEVDPISIKTTWVGGFNRKWGLPLPQRLAVQSGSVVRLKNFNPAPEQLTTIKQVGIGERLEDGFGRVAIGWQHEQSDENPLLLEKYVEEPNYEEVPLSDESKVLRNRIRSRIRDRRLQEEIAGILFNSNYTIHGSITRTQISRLRAQISNQLRLPKPNRGFLRSFLTTISGKSAGRQFENARLGNRSFTAWLIDPKFEELGDGINRSDRYVLQLVDTVLERAYLERDKKAKEDN